MTIKCTCGHSYIPRVIHRAVQDGPCLADIRVVVAASLHETASELQARPPENLNRDWADRMAEALATAGLLAGAGALFGGGPIPKQPRIAPEHPAFALRPVARFRGVWNTAHSRSFWRPSMTVLPSLARNGP